MRLAERGGSLWLPPLLAFLAVNLILWVAAAVDGFNYFDPRTWAHWDSIHYVDIAENGYTYVGCNIINWWSPFSVVKGLLSGLGVAIEPTRWCGTAGWFPGYPALIRLLTWVGPSPVAAGVAIAIAAQLGTLSALWAWFLRTGDRFERWLVLLTATFFFGHIYYRAVFPMSLTTLLLLTYVYLLGKQRWLLVGLAGAAAAFTYPTVFVIAPVTVVWLWGTRSDLTRREKLVASALSAGVTILGFLAVLVVQWLQTDVWGAFFNVQSQFDYGINVPVERLSDVLQPLWQEGLTLHTVPDLHTGLVAITMSSVTFVCLKRWRSLSPVQMWVVLATLALWLFPLTLGGRASLYRIESVLLPMVILLPKMPRWFLLGLAGVLIALSYPMALLFYRNILI